MKDMIQKTIDLGFKVLEITMVVLLACMVIMVFGNVMLRYLFDSGIVQSEELSRYFFVWLTFVGAVVVYREHAHLGVDSLVKALPMVGRRVCMAASDMLVLVCCALFFYGTFRQHGLNASNFAPITQLPMTWVYGIGYLTSLGIGAMVILRLVRNITGSIDEAEVRIFAGEWDDPKSDIKGRTE